VNVSHWVWVNMLHKKNCTQMRRRWQVSSAKADINILLLDREGFYIAFLYATKTNQWHLPRSPNWEQLKSSTLQTIKWTLSYQNNLSVGGCSVSKHENLQSEPDNWSTHPFINEEVIQIVFQLTKENTRHIYYLFLLL